MSFQQIPRRKLSSTKEIVFSSDDSFNSDNSFNSSLENDNNDEQMNQMFIANPDLLSGLNFDPFDPQEEEEKVKEEEKKKPKDLHKQVPLPNYVSVQNEEESVRKQKDKQQKQKSELWNSLSRNIVQNAQQASKIPSLETVNHRLNVYEHVIEHVNYVDLLAKEGEEREQKESNNNESETNKESGNNAYANIQKKKVKNEQEAENNEEYSSASKQIEYFSFRKKQQMKAQQLREQQLEIKNRKSLQRQLQAAIAEQLKNEAQDYSEEPIKVPPKQKAGRIQPHTTSATIQGNLRRNTTLSPTIEVQKKESVVIDEAAGLSSLQLLAKRMSTIQLQNFISKPQQTKEQVLKPNQNQRLSIKMPDLKSGPSQFKGINAIVQSKANQSAEDCAIDANKLYLQEQEQYKSKIGKALFQNLEQSNGNIESFRKYAQSTLKDYAKSKSSLIKARKFPPNLPKFIGDDCSYLNQLLPDFSSPFIQQVSKSGVTDPFAEIANYEPLANSQEAEILGVVDQISKGKLLQVWKNQQAF